MYLVDVYKRKTN